MFLYSPPIPPRPLSTPAGVERGSLVPICPRSPDTESRAKGRIMKLFANILNVPVVVNGRAVAAARLAALRARERQQTPSHSLRPQRLKSSSTNTSRDLTSVIWLQDSNNQIGIQPPLSTPAGVERGRGGIGGGKEAAPCKGMHQSDKGSSAMTPKWGPSRPNWACNTATQGQAQ